MRKILVLLLLISVISAQGQSVLDTRTNISLDNVSLEKAIINLSQTNQINISFNPSILPENIFVNINAVNETIGDVLKNMLDKTDIGYKLVSGQIVLYKLPPKPKKKYTIRGYITDKENGEFMEGAHVFVGNGNHGTFSNQYGFYSLTLTEGYKDLLFSFLAYQNIQQKINLDQNIRLDISMESSLSLPQIVVFANDSTQGITPFQIGRYQFKLPEIKMQPSIGGEDDIFSRTNLLPGVQTSADGSGGLHVRGGSSDQNLILLDDVPIYNSKHAVGIFSIYNTDAIKSAKILKGSFPARYGGRLSSVMDIRMKEGNKKKFTTAFSQSFIASNVIIEGPIIKGKGSYFVSGRRSITDLYIPKISKILNENKHKNSETDYFFYDVNGKINYTVTPKNRVYFSFYNGSDTLVTLSKYNSITIGPNRNLDLDTLDFSIFRNYSIGWGNAMMAVRWNKELRHALFLNTTYTFSKYDFHSNEDNQFLGKYRKELDFIKRSSQSKFKEELRTQMLKLDFDYTPNPKHYIRFGGNIALHGFSPGIIKNTFIGEIDSIEFNINQPVIEKKEINGYFEDEIHVGNMTANLGLRALGWEIGSKFQWYLQPRISISTQMNDKTLVNLSYSKMVQPLHLLSKPNIAFSAEIWLPATEKVLPQKAWQISGGINQKLESKILIGVELYYKKLDDIVTFLPTVDSLLILDATNWEEKIAIGEGWNYGIELSIQKDYGRLQGSINYALSKSDRLYDILNEGKIYPFTYDRRHVVNFLANYKLKENFFINSSFIFSTSTALTLPVKQYKIPGEGTVHIGDEKINTHRITPYNRLDLGCTYFRNHKKFKQSFKFGIYNIYNQFNTFYIEIRPKANSIKSGVFTNSLFPILPYFKYKINFLW